MEPPTSTPSGSAVLSAYASGLPGDDAGALGAAPSLTDGNGSEEVVDLDRLIPTSPKFQQHPRIHQQC